MLPDVVGGQLNPRWVEWLMNWPRGWTNLEAVKNEDFQEWLAQTGPKATGGNVRIVWWDNDPSGPPPRQRPMEQRPKEHQDVVCDLPRETSRTPEVVGAHQAEAMRPLRKDIQVQAGERNNLRTVVRQQGGLGEAKIIPRTAKGVEHRVDRLRALGNGQVPGVVREAWQRLEGEE